jgi:hypothetical protein
MIVLISEEQWAFLGIGLFVVVWSALFVVAMAIEQRKRARRLKSTDWIVKVGEHHVRSTEELREWVAAGRITAHNIVWSPIAKQWRLAFTIPEIKDLFPYFAPAATSPSNQEVGCALGGLLLIGILAWGVYAFVYAPRHRVTAPPPPTSSSTTTNPNAARETPEEAVRLVLAATLPPDAEPRLEFLEGANLNIYVTRQQFETIPFPDREDAVELIGKAWCKNVEHTYLPVVCLRDIRTGEEFASYSCTTGHTSVKERQ